MTPSSLSILVVSSWRGVRHAVPFDLDNLPMPDFIFNEEPTSKPASVLVVEDCTLTQHVITSLLKELTPHVAQAFDGEQAIFKCDEAQYDIIFMDMNMPKINGLQATQRIRKSGKNTWVPIIAFTSAGSLNDYRSYGVDDMLSKPFSTESLSHIFDKWTEHTRGDTGAIDTTANTAMPGQMAGGLAAMPTQQQSTFKPSLTAQLQPPPSIPTFSFGVGYAQAGKPGKMGKIGKPEASPRNAHNIKEKQRRANISQAADDFRNLVPTVSTSDKATVYTRAVEYVRFLRTSITVESLEQLDKAFSKQIHSKAQPSPTEPQGPGGTNPMATDPLSPNPQNPNHQQHDPMTPNQQNAMTPNLQNPIPQQQNPNPNPGHPIPIATDTKSTV